MAMELAEGSRGQGWAIEAQRLNLLQEWQSSHRDHSLGIIRRTLGQPSQRRPWSLSPLDP